MADLRSILTDPNYTGANAATKQAIFERYSAQDPNYVNANEATKQAIKAKYGVLEVASAPAAAPMSVEAMQEQAMAATDLPQYGARPDGTQKGQGFLGAISLPTGGVATEYSTQSDAVTVNGQRIDFPTLVPTLTQQEVELMRNDIIPNQKPIPESIMQKAIQHANSRLASGLPVFADQAAPAPQRPPEQGMGQRMLEQILLPADIGASVLSAFPGLAVYGGQAFAGLIDSIRRGTYGSSVGGQQMSQRAMEGLQQTIIQPRTQMGQQVMQAAADVAEELKLAPTPVGTALQALARPAAQQAAAAVAPAARQAGTALVETGRQAGTAIAETARRVPEAIAPSPGAEAKPPETIANVFRPGQQRRRAELARIIQEDPYNTEAVRFRLSDGSVKPDTEADQVLKQGWREGAVSVIKAATDKDRDSMLRMLSIYKRGKKNDRYRALNRPADVVGESLQSRVDYIDGQRKEAGQAIDRIADTQLAGQQVEYAPLVDRFVANLNSLGVKVRSDQAGRRFVDLKDSEIQGDTQAETLLNNVLARMSDVTGPPDAKAMHDLKRYLDTQISYGGRPQMNPLTATAERQVKNLRRDINSTLASRFPDYGTENERYSNTLQALSDLQKAAGTSIDFDSPNANKALGTALRKITSNYATRVNLMDALDQTDQVAKKYGMQIDDDIINQTIFANEIDRMFGAVADTSLKGQVAQAAETGLDFARKSNTERALSLVQAGIEKVKGVNEENALKRMEELLKRRSQTTPGTAMVPVE